MFFVVAFISFCKALKAILFCRNKRFEKVEWMKFFKTYRNIL